MYESLLAWCRFPVYIHRYSSGSISGDTTFTTTQACGYRVDEVTNITDKTGNEYVSGMQVYFPPSVSITAEDMISFSLTGAPQEIKKIGGFYDGNTGSLSITVVYL